MLSAAQVWGDARPPAPAAPLRMHKLEHAGESVGDKLARMRTEMAGEWALCMLWPWVLVHRQVLDAAMQAWLHCQGP